MPRARTRGRGKSFVTPELLVRERPAEAARPRRARTLGRRPDPRAREFGHRDARRADDAVHGPAPPAPDGRPRGQPRQKNGPALAGHGAEAVREAIAQAIGPLPGAPPSLADVGPGRGDGSARRLRETTGLAVYFCDPRSPWQRGTNENTNGLLRQYFPKGTDLAAHGATELAAVALALNTRPRKTLGWRTPAEAMEELLRSTPIPSVATTG